MAAGAPAEKPRRDRRTAGVRPGARPRARPGTAHSPGALRDHCPRDRRPERPAPLPLRSLVASLEGLEASRADNLAEVIERYPWVHRAATVALGAFTFCSWKPTDPVLRALKALRQFYASDRRKLPAGVPTAFLPPAWRKLIGRGSALDPRGWEVAVIVTLRDRLRAGDLWVEGSRAFQAFDDFLLPPAAFAAKRQAGELGLAVPDRFEAWRDERLETLAQRLREVAALAAAGQL